MFSMKGNKEALAGGKGVVGDHRSEVSHTAKVCTDEQEESETTIRFGTYEASVGG